MNFSLTSEQEEARKWAGSFAKEMILPLAHLHSKQKIERNLLQKLSAEGFMTLRVPEKLGGLGLDAISFSLVIREISKACGSVGVTVAVTNMVAETLVR